MRILNSLITHVGMHSWLWNFVYFIAPEPDSQEFHCSPGLSNPFLNLEMYNVSKPQNILNFFSTFSYSPPMKMELFIPKTVNI